VLKIFFMSSEFHSIDPELGWLRPAMIRSNVDLPEPFLPVSKRASPGISSKFRLVNTNLSLRLAARFNPDQVDKDRSSMVNLISRKIDAGEPHYASL